MTDEDEHGAQKDEAKRLGSARFRQQTGGILVLACVKRGRTSQQYHEGLKP